MKAVCRSAGANVSHRPFRCDDWLSESIPNAPGLIRQSKDCYQEANEYHPFAQPS